jgi:hypothetical protein
MRAWVFGTLYKSFYTVIRLMGRAKRLRARSSRRTATGTLYKNFYTVVHSTRPASCCTGAPCVVYTHYTFVGSTAGNAKGRPENPVALLTEFVSGFRR